MNNNYSKDLILEDIYIIYKKYGIINNKIYKEYGKYDLKIIKSEFKNLKNAIIEFNKLNSLPIVLFENNNTNDIDINKDKIKSLCIDYYNKNNYITKKEFIEILDTPYFINKYFSNFTNLLKECNIYDDVMNKFSKKQSKIRNNYIRSNSNKVFEFSRNEAIELAKTMFDEVGEIKKTTFLIYSNYDTKTFLNMFGTFTNFLKEADLYKQMKIINNSKKGTKNNNFYNGNNKIKNFTKEDCFNKAREILNSEKNITKDLFFKKSNYDKKTFLNMFNNSFREFIKESGLYGDVKNNRNKKHHKSITISKEDLINEILDFVKTNNINSLKSNDLYSNTNITQNHIKKFWGTFGEMKKELNLESIKEKYNPTKEEIINHMWYLYHINNNKLTSAIQRNDGKFSAKIINKNFGSFSNMLTEMGLNINIPRNISEIDLISDLKSIVNEYGILTERLITYCGKYSYQTYINKLGGSLTEICNKIGIIQDNNINSCSSNIASYCITIFSKIFNDTNYVLEQTFDWLVNPNTNAKMRLDGYFPNLKIAIEYDGIQHFEYIEKFDKTYDNFLKRQQRDKLKNELCKNNNIKLIRIKYDEPLTIDYLKTKI